MNDDQYFLAQLGYGDCEKIGEGQEATVYNIGEGKVLKLLKTKSVESATREKRFYEKLSTHKLPFSVPLIFSLDEIDGRYYVVEKMLVGSPLSTILKTEKDPVVRNSLLRQYIEVVHALGQVDVWGKPYSYLIATNPHRANDWREFFVNRIHDFFSENRAYIEELVDADHYQKVYIAKANELLANLEIRPSLIHGDYWPPNILVKDGSISAVLDFNNQTCVGDVRLDVAGALSFLEDFVSKEEMKVVRVLASELYGDDLEQYVSLYEVYYALQFLRVKEIDPKSYAWAASVVTKAQ